MGQINYTMSEFYCTQCGSKAIPIWRKKGREREAGHLKKLYCLHCKRENNCVEVKPFTKYSYLDFCIEFEYGNFTENGERKMPYGELKELIRNGKIEKVKTMDDVRDPGFRKIDLDTES